jgi:hypothetical protein
MGTRLYYDEGRPTSTNFKSGQSIGLCSVLFIVFLVLKLCDLITWSWIWVFSPLWIPIAFVLIITVALLLIGAVMQHKK